MRVKAYVSQAFAELGDHVDRAAPIREVTIVGYDGGRYADVIVCGQPAKCEFRRIAVRGGQTGHATHATPKPKSPAMVKRPADFQTTYSRIKAMQDNPRASIHARVRAAQPAPPPN